MCGATDPGHSSFAQSLRLAGVSGVWYAKGTMLVLRRVAHEPISGAAYEIHEVLHTSFRVRVTRTVGVTVDESLFYPTTKWTGDGARPQVEVALRGAVRNTQPPDVRWIRPGEFSIGRSLENFWARVEDDSLVLSVDWALGSLGNVAPSGLPIGTLDEDALRKLEAAAHTLATPGSEGFALIPEVLDTLRRAGVPFDAIDPRDLTAVTDEDDRAVAAALTHAMSNLNAAPMSVDLEQTLGRSRRQVVELVRRVAARFGLNGEDWRTLRDRFRLTSAAVLATHRAARTEHVAHAVGYGSARALCTALARAGLPTPGNMRREVDALR